MTSLVASELLKFRTTRAWIGFLVVVVALTGLASAGTVGAAEEVDLGTTQLSRDIVSSALFAALVVFIIGIIAVTSEWRHGTITRTFLVTPRRGRVLLAKEIWIAMLAAVLAALSLLVVLAVAVPWLAFEGSSLEANGDLARLAGRIVLASMLWGALGVGIGAIVHGQTPALVGSILWILLGEALLTALLGLVDAGDVGDYLPGRALSAFDGSDPGGLSVWAGGAVAVAWIVALGVLGYLRMAREDVT
jgi:ABC-type transport system involved in multi-copper enzyme maturation permease subunit